MISYHEDNNSHDPTPLQNVTKLCSSSRNYILCFKNDPRPINHPESVLSFTLTAIHSLTVFLTPPHCWPATTSDLVTRQKIKHHLNSPIQPRKSKHPQKHTKTQTSVSNRPLSSVGSVVCVFWRGYNRGSWCGVVCHSSDGPEGWTHLWHIETSLHPPR